MKKLMFSRFMLGKKERESSDLNYLKRNLNIAYLIILVSILLLIGALLYFTVKTEVIMKYNDKLIVLREGFYKKYYKQDNIKKAMKDILKDSYIENEDYEENFNNYVIALVSEDIQKYEEKRWKHYSGFVTEKRLKAAEDSIKEANNAIYKAAYDVESIAKNIENEQIFKDSYYIKTQRFANGITTKLFKEKIEEMKKYSNLIIDLRDNPGGELLELIEFLNLFNNKDSVILKSKFYKSGEEIIETIKAKKDRSIEFKKIIILINENTASCAELATVSLKDTQDNVQIIGTRSFGKGISVITHKFTDGTGLAYVNRYWYGPNDIEIHNKGIEPDVYAKEEVEQIKEIERYLKQE